MTMRYYFIRESMGYNKNSANISLGSDVMRQKLSFIIGGNIWFKHNGK